MKNVAIIAGIFIFIGAIGTIYYFYGKEYVLRFSENQIREKLNEKMPLTKTYFIIFQITLDNPRVNMTDGSKRVNAGFDLILNIQIGQEKMPFGGLVDVSGGVKYISQEGTFYLTDPIIEQLSVQGIPKKYTNKVNSVLTRVLGEYYANHPIYTLKGLDVKQAAAKIILKDVTVENRELVLKLGV